MPDLAPRTERQFWRGLTAGLRRLDDEDRALRRVRHRVRDAAEHAALHALVAHDEDVGAALLRKADGPSGGSPLRRAVLAFCPRPLGRARFRYVAANAGLTQVGVLCAVCAILADGAVATGR